MYLIFFFIFQKNGKSCAHTDVYTIFTIVIVPKLCNFMDVSGYLSLSTMYDNWTRNNLVRTQRYIYVQYPQSTYAVISVVRKENCYSRVTTTNQYVRRAHIIVRSVSHQPAVFVVLLLFLFVSFGCLILFHNFSYFAWKTKAKDKNSRTRIRHEKRKKEQSKRATLKGI